MVDPNPDGGSLEDKVRALRSVATYPEHPASVETIETHFAWVFLLGERAYKLKKPVNVPGMDLSTLDARRLSCAEELRLNRRLAPDVYLDVVPLVRAADATLRVGGEGAIVDWLVRMRRLPAALMLDRAIAAGTASAGEARGRRGDARAVLPYATTRCIRAGPVRRANHRANPRRQACALRA